jgi:UDP-N-acetylglucosamine 4,6-dehydratase/5-epimerase
MNNLNKKVLLITGGTGSFGNALTSLLVKYNCEIRIFSRDELKQHSMRDFYNNKKIKFFIGDTRDKSSLKQVMKNVDYVFHAAALKQVPSCEFFPDQAVKTNINGSINVIDAAIENKVKKVIGLSTDKAVQPINSMGMSKALMEKIFISRSRLLGKKDTILSIVRYGNVLFSRGSVIPLFIQQINDGRPISITTKNMTRFLISLDDAIQMVLDSISLSSQGDIFIRKSKSSYVHDIGLNLFKIFNKKPNIQFIGKRHGEKEHEVLATKEELQNSKNLKNYFIIKMDSRDLNYDQYFKKGNVMQEFKDDYSSLTSKKISSQDLQGIFKKYLNMQ